MKTAKKHFYIITIALLLTLFGLSVGAQMKNDIQTLSNITLETRERNTRGEMKAVLQVARETVMQHVKLGKIDMSTEEGLQRIIEECIIPLNAESTTSNVILVQVRPEIKILYNKRPVTLPEELIRAIESGIDNNFEDKTTYSISDVDRIFEWVGIPPGISSFDNSDTKWVLILKKDKQVVETTAKSILSIQKDILHRLYFILIISCLVVIVTVVTIYQMQKTLIQCTNPDCKNSNKH